jgi:hypothetical protein
MLIPVTFPVCIVSKRHQQESFGFFIVGVKMKTLLKHSRRRDFVILHLPTCELIFSGDVHFFFLSKDINRFH